MQILRNILNMILRPIFLIQDLAYIKKAHKGRYRILRKGQLIDPKRFPDYSKNSFENLH